MRVNKSAKAVLLAVAVAVAVGSVPAVGGAADAAPHGNKAILKAIL